jgi:hypothetical protein
MTKKRALPFNDGWTVKVRKRDKLRLDWKCAHDGSRPQGQVPA